MPVAQLVPAGRSVADIGTGDGKLAAWLAAAGHQVIATENKPGPREEALRVLRPLGIECRLGEGLEPIRPGEVEVAVIAGMGGRTILRILAGSPHVVGSLEALVVQPMHHSEELRAELLARGYRVSRGQEIEQRSRGYSALLILPPYSIAK
ncbi:MAG: class I SAM-dependent methyltransferase [Candidatus Dormibacteraeota bacterium]|nr:class I SAM-dependent methyltransferase [Candidatus Dormibacteraeota bacterium]